MLASAHASGLRPFAKCAIRPGFRVTDPMTSDRNSSPQCPAYSVGSKRLRRSCLEPARQHVRADRLSTSG